MKIGIIGAGGIGCVVAAYLVKAGNEVTLVGRKKQVDAINANGLSIKGVRGGETFRVNALESLDSDVDLVIFTVKTQDLEAAYQANCEFIDNEDVIVLTSQNGVQADNILSGHFYPDQMLSSIVMFGATYTQPGEVTFNFEGDWIVGKPYGANAPKTHEIADVLRQAFNVVVSDNIMGMKWLKLFVNFNNCLPALCGQSMQETYSNMDMCRLSVELTREGVAVTKKLNIALESLPSFPVDRIFGLVSMPVDKAASIINQTLPKLSKEPLYGSILQSIMRQRPSEIDFINGEVVHIAKQIHMKSPLNEMVVDMVHNVEKTEKFYTFDEIKNAFCSVFKEKEEK